MFSTFLSIRQMTRGANTSSHMCRVVHS